MFKNQSLRMFLIDELEINLITDDMFEWHLIELDTHEQIRSLSERTRKVNTLLSQMDIITDDTWFVKFCCILTKHVENTIVIDRIRHYVSRAENAGNLRT